MRNSGILKWAQNNKNNKMSNGRSKDKGKSWVHSPDTLLKGHVVYLVKFLGSTEVDQPKGIEVVKQGIQKLKFSSQLKKSEGNKTPKVELTISVDGVAIQDPKTKRMMHQYQLQRISYCADDKAEKRFFSFIAKEEESNRHTCFVFVSDKLAEEITLTIGQAFELAYKRFLDTNGRDLEMRKQVSSLQKKIAQLENETNQLKTRLRDIANIKGQQDIQAYMSTNKLKDICQVSLPDEENIKEQNGDTLMINGHSNPQNEGKNSSPNELICLEESEATAEQLDNFTLDDLNDEDFNPRANVNGPSDDDDEFDPRGSSHNNSGKSDQTMMDGAPMPAMISPPPALPPRDPYKINNNNVINGTIYPNLSSPTLSANPFANGGDLFGMGNFQSPVLSPGKNNHFDGELLKASFSLDELDPLKN